MCQIGGRGLIGGSQRVIYHAGRQLINNNGTAVEGVCVTGEASRVLVLFANSGVVPVANQYGAIFAITVRVGFCAIAV
jgi:hypothetical protein